MEYSGKNVVIMTCSNCNAKCKHCYISYSGNFESKQLLELVNTLKSKYDVQLNGTEIILHPEFFPVLKIVKQKSIMTNGIEIFKNPKIVDELIKYGVSEISMSYHLGIHKKISTVNEKIILSNIKLLKEKGIRPKIMVTIDKDNYKEIESMCDYIYSLGLDYIKFTNYLQMGKAISLDKNNILTPEQISIFFEQLRKVRAKYDREELTIKRCGSFGIDYNNPECNFKCLAYNDLVVITPDLNVYPCIFLTIPGFEIGKVIDGKIIINEKAFNKADKCLACEIHNKQNKIETLVRKTN